MSTEGSERISPYGCSGGVLSSCAAVERTWSWAWAAAASGEASELDI